MTQQTQTIESLDLNLAKIFNDYYVVPSFQREYVWETGQVEQLLQDIHDEFSEDGQAAEYFIGSLVVSPGRDDVLELIDGQQRMTTAYIFLCAVRDMLEERGEDAIPLLQQQIASTDIDDLGRNVFRYRIELQYDDSGGILEHIAKGENGSNPGTPNTRSIANMLNAYQTIRTFLQQQFGEDTEGLRRFYSYFTKRVKLVRIKTQSVAHALKVFETINDRGVGLDAMDLLKNLMFMQAEASDFDALKNEWKGLVDELYDAKEKPLRFLRYFIFANYAVKEKLREDQIYRWFVENEKLCGYKDNPRDFVRKLSRAAEAYSRFVQGKNIDGTDNRYLVNIRYLSGAARQHLILLLAGMHLSIEDFTELCRQLENLFFAYLITREPTKEFEYNFARWAPELRKVQNREQLDAFIAANIKPAKDNLALRYRQAFESLNEYGIQKYRLRYVLGKLAQYVNEMAYSTPTGLDQYVNGQVDVEHILPQHPSPAVSSSFDKPQEIDDYIHQLGNLTLLEKSINASVGNGLFSAKKSPYQQSKFLITKTLGEKVTVGTNTAVDRAVRELLTFDEWNSETITLRQLNLAELAVKVWDMPEARTETRGQSKTN